MLCQGEFLIEQLIGFAVHSIAFDATFQLLDHEKLTPELSLRVGVWDEYDSTEPPGFEENDLRVYGSMVFDF